MQTLQDSRPVKSQDDGSSAIVQESPGQEHDPRADHLRLFAVLLLVLNNAFPPVLALFQNVKLDAGEITRLTSSLGGFWTVPAAMMHEANLAIGLLFVLSGFLLARKNNNRDISIKAFYQNKALRIYPLYLLFILLSLYMNPGSQPLQGLSLSILGLQNLAGANPVPALTEHLWTVAVILQFYLIFPFIHADYRLRGPRSLFLFLATAIALKSLAYFITKDVQSLASYTIFGRIDQLFIGMMLGYSFPFWKKHLRNPCFFALALCIAVSLMIFMHTHHASSFAARKFVWVLWPSIEAAFWGFVILSYSAAAFSPSAKLSRLLSFLGSISFSLYVVHYPLCTMLANRLFKPFSDLSTAVLHPLFANSQSEFLIAGLIFSLLITVPASIVVASLAHFLVEKPVLQRKVRYQL